MNDEDEGTSTEGGSVGIDEEENFIPICLHLHNRVFDLKYAVKYLLIFPFCSPARLLYNLSFQNFEFSASEERRGSSS